MRQSVRQARICVINKLIREAKRLRTNSNEKQLEKNKNKAEKLLKEVFALKRIKDDEISKFGIIKFEYLQNILQNPQTDDGTRAMVKVVRHKSLSLRIIEFQKKFPDYSKYISWRKKKSSVKEKKGNCYIDSEKNSKRLKNDANNILKKEKRQNCFIDFPEKNSKQLKNDSSNIIEKINKENIKDADNINCIAYIPCQQTINVEENNDNSMKISKNQDMEIQSINNDQNFKIIKNLTKIISNEATVKRFTEILQETKEQNYICKDTENQQSFSESMEFMDSSNKIDDFFLPANEVTSCSNEALFSKEKSMYSEQVNRIFKSRKNVQVENKNKLYSKKISKEKRNNRKQFMNNANFHNPNDMIEKTNTYRKQNEKNIQVEKKRKINKESTCIVEHDNLHPSWAAKKKQQNIMKQEFQGKKIKFDED